MLKLGEALQVSEAVGKATVRPAWRPTDRTDPGLTAEWTAAHPAESSYRIAYFFRVLEAGTLDLNVIRRRLGHEIREYDQCSDAGGRDHYMLAILHLARELAL